MNPPEHEETLPADVTAVPLNSQKEMQDDEPGS